MKNWIRWGLTVVLLLSVYSETGPFTTLALTLITIRGELVDSFLGISR